MKALICLVLILLLAGCVPIGIRASTQLTADAVERSASPPARATS